MFSSCLISMIFKQKFQFLVFHSRCCLGNHEHSKARSILAILREHSVKERKYFPFLGHHMAGLQSIQEAEAYLWCVMSLMWPSAVPQDWMPYIQRLVSNRLGIYSFIRKDIPHTFNFLRNFIKSYDWRILKMVRKFLNLKY